MHKPHQYTLRASIFKEECCSMKNFEVFTPVQLRWEACFYCGGHLPALKKEHIFNSSWTGKHKTGALICDECNAAFSFSVDTAFKSYTKYHMNVWSLKGERQKSVPTIETEGEIIIKSGAQPEEKPSSFLVTRRVICFIRPKHQINQHYANI